MSSTRLGRPLTEDEQADILRAHGHPLVVAGRYQPGGYLIGPTLFPFFVFVLKLGVALVASVAPPRAPDAGPHAEGEPFCLAAISFCVR